MVNNIFAILKDPLLERYPNLVYKEDLSSNFNNIQYLDLFFRDLHYVVEWHPNHGFRLCFNPYLSLLGDGEEYPFTELLEKIYHEFDKITNNQFDGDPRLQMLLKENIVKSAISLINMSTRRFIHPPP